LLIRLLVKTWISEDDTGACLFNDCHEFLADLTAEFEITAVYRLWTISLCR